MSTFVQIMILQFLVSWAKLQHISLYQAKMTLGLQHLRELNSPGSEDQGGGCTDADIVAVHGLNEDSIAAWTEPDSGVLWLRGLVPMHIPKVRVLSFGYDGSPILFDDVRIVDKIQSLAVTLVADLAADRSLENCEHRPIIFVCHGLGE
ncbi:hypothetical protein PHISCL_01693 [Aspergillus sclerotialis]|uniref:Uncharacterized protein n=1 Tax=Aspergillus sclerotialis TaxID=2070753 RepID=A0A3A2ZS80_9EURO|nr:hypothetical protein PHISCL_01693 [Aspergillus sclerotialis]